MLCQPSLPHDLFHSHIIPDILSEHLHLLLVENEAPSWHPFHTLPLVSFAFRKSCQSLCVAIFGLERDDDGSAIFEIITFAQSVWAQARLPSEQAAPLEFNYSELMSNMGLIRVYVCIALARLFLNVDVLLPLARQAASELGGIRHDGADVHTGENDLASGTRKFRMRDEKMHRLYMPLTCATKLCDSIIPTRLACTAAKYLADIIPMYSTLPVMLKYTQDLESYVERGHRVQMETYIEWTFQTLGLIERCGDLLTEMQATGRLVNSFTRSSLIPYDVIHATSITKALRDVVDADWGTKTEEIRGRASAFLQRCTRIQ
ncbi:hypothetical protein JB92DRAFT_2938645 [Gautieria morchelliformis]|nr:hypothetical protein JB92DRAFT_2938645 [Gautieria morchelliformis]